MNKASLYALADQAGVRYPETVLIKSHADVRTAASAIPFPCLLKPTLSHRWRSLFGDP
ncbi:MAG: hypothetical protein AVDCRST_MAG90-2509, partial [uncultured Microvirga sp.]